MALLPRLREGSQGVSRPLLCGDLDVRWRRLIGDSILLGSNEWEHTNSSSNPFANTST